MVVAVGLWSIVLEPGKENIVVPQSDLRITNVALGEKLQDPNGRSTVKLSYLPLSALAEDSEDDDEENPKPPSGDDIATAVICSLTGGKTESTTVDITLEDDSEYLFEVVGKNAVHLIGNYIDQTPHDFPPYDEGSDESGSDEEDAYDLRDVSSDVAMDPEDLDTDAERFEEVAQEPPKSTKRPRPSDTNDGPASAKSDKKASKKLKAADGAAVNAESASAAPEKKKKEKKEKKSDAPEAKQPEKTLAGGLKIKDTKVGAGPQAKKGSKVSMRYIGKLDDGGIFDKNTKGKPFTFKLGGGEVIKGWDEGILGMQVGGERTLIVPPGMAYGKQKLNGIPPNSTLNFEVKLLEIK